MPRKKKIQPSIIQQIRTHLDQLESAQGNRRTFLNVHADHWGNLVEQVQNELQQEFERVDYVIVSGVEVFPSKNEDGWYPS